MSSDFTYAEKVLAELPAPVRDSLGKDGASVVAEALDAASGDKWKTSPHGIDARYNIPWFGGRAYMRVLAGREKRPSNRTRKENKQGVGRKIANFVAIIIVACGFYTVAGLGLLMASAVLE